MGSSTDFKGKLKFVNELTASQLAKLNEFMGEDCRDHPEWGEEGMTYIDLEITKDFTGIQWDGSEKTYDLPEKINLIISQMQKEWPDFGLEGFFIAQGDAVGDIWRLSIKDGKAIQEDIPLDSGEVECPECGHRFQN